MLVNEGDINGLRFQLELESAKVFSYIRHFTWHLRLVIFHPPAF